MNASVTPLNVSSKAPAVVGRSGDVVEPTNVAWVPSSSSSTLEIMSAPLPPRSVEYRSLVDDPSSFSRVMKASEGPFRWPLKAFEVVGKSSE